MNSSYDNAPAARNPARKLESLVGPSALRQRAWSTGFIKRARKMDPATLILAALATFAAGRPWSETSIRDSCCQRMESAGLEGLNREVFHDHISKPSFAAMCRDLYSAVSRAAGMGELDQGAELVRAVASLRDEFKDKGETSGSLMIHSMHSLKSCAESQFSIGAGTSCERTAMLDMDLKGLLVMADAGYFSAEVCQELERRGAWHVIKVPDSNACRVIDCQKVGRSTGAGKVAHAREIMGGSMPDAKDLISKNCSYDLNASTAGGFEHREAIVRRQDAEGRFGHGRFATNILDAIQISDLYRARWQIELQFKCFKSFSSLKADRIATPSIIEAFIDLSRTVHALNLVIGQAAQQAAGAALSQQKAAGRCSAILEDLPGMLIKGSARLAGRIKRFLCGAATRLAKSTLSFINRKRGKCLSCIIESIRMKSRTALVHIPALPAQAGPSPATA